MELQDEGQQQEHELSRLQQERLGLLRDAREARRLRDELDCAEQKLLRLEQLETENEKFRAKVAEVICRKIILNNIKN